MSSEVSRTYLALNQRRRECLFQRLKPSKVIQSTSRKGIANVFGEFCSKLFACNETDQKLQNTLTETRAHDEENTKVKVTMKKYL